MSSTRGRDVDEYLRLAGTQKLTITYVIETHRQEDFVLGSSELARITGARIVNGAHEGFGHGDIRLKDREELSFGGLRLRALHTPGHTPESLCYALYIPDSPERAWGVFTGDALFIGETGRTDLPDPGKTGENAGRLYDAVHEKLLPLGDQALLYPAHGSGTVCGGNVADRDESTLGLERLYNPVFTKTREEFMAAKVKERLPRPPYFAVMEKLNSAGSIALARRPEEITVLQPEAFSREMGRGIVIDTRSPEAFSGGHIPNALSIWATGLPVFGGWVAGPDTPVYLLLESPGALDEAVLALARIGVDGVQGILAGGFEAWRDAGLPIETSGTIAPRELEARLDQFRVIDVREDSELEEGHIPNAAHLYVGYLDRHLGRITPPLDKSRPIAVTCSVGHRASLAVSLLQRQGFPRVENLLGGMTAWSALALSRETTPDYPVTTTDVEGPRQ
ncbi:MBL fold metallo-hydrolase [Candidatus Methylobacter favarea]|nr:rhodanese-like domain-containing protein [Candidatus Methylobacter favarea]